MRVGVDGARRESVGTGMVAGEGDVEEGGRRVGDCEGGHVEDE